MTDEEQDQLIGELEALTLSEGTIFDASMIGGFMSKIMFTLESAAAITASQKTVDRNGNELGLQISVVAALTQGILVGMKIERNRKRARQ